MGSGRVRPARWTLLASLGLLAAGAGGHFSLQRGSSILYAFAHVGALGVVGLLATSAAALARRKGRNFWKAFSLTFGLSIISGVAAVLIFLLGIDGNLYCGGSVSLIVAILMIVFYSLARQRTPA